MNFKENLNNFPKKTWDYIKLARIELIIIALVLILDLVSKAIIAGVMNEYDSVTLIPNFLYITFITNDKAAFSWDFGLSNVIGIEGTRIVFLIVTFIAVIIFSYVMYRFRGKHMVSRLAFALIISGALGNFIDRLFLKYVRDFIEFRYFGLKLFGSYSFPIFNVADIALTVGVVLFLVFYLFLYKDNKDKNSATTGATAAGNSVKDGKSVNNATSQKNDAAKEPTEITASNENEQSPKND